MSFTPFPAKTMSSQTVLNYDLTKVFHVPASGPMRRADLPT
jgi:hypothetical protein